MVIVITVFVGMLVCLQLPSLLKLGSRRDLLTYLILMGLAYILMVLRTVGVHLPYVTSAIVRVFKAVLGRFI
ncbi:MAG TPA: hypothetical protein GX391_03265 [Firmicutes bacterium]|jgi:hypothetical protein|nr:hypothetical protein [Bacillota bacterium]HOQ24099.1 hypothetical protein [Bacillota bacterium]HPT66405.1 hypothetical protein [Bacillota bacterium]